MKWQNMGAGPIQCKRFNDAWGKLNWENNTFVELTGVTGVDEHSATLTAIFGGNVREDVAAAKEKIGVRFNWTISKETVNTVIEAIMAELPALKANRPVKDQRRSPEQEQQRNDEVKQIEIDRGAKDKAQRETFIRLYGNGETVTVQPGQMAITARICYNNSDAMTDYFDSHAGYSPRFALRVVPKQAETERLARQAVESFALLAAVEFSWHTEKYSMGHGNYLQSKGFELLPELQGFRDVYRGGPVTHGHWEIEFSSYDKTLPTFQGYGDTRKALAYPPGSPEYEALKNRIAELEKQPV